MENIKPESPNQFSGPVKNRHLLVFFVIFFLCLAVLIWGYLIFKNQSKNQEQAQGPVNKPVITSFERDINKMKKIDQTNQTLPAGFPKDIPFYNPSTVTDKYNLQDERLKEPTEAVVVFKSSAAPEEIKQFYLKKFKTSAYKFVEGSDAASTEQKKIIVFYNSDGILIIITNQTETGSLTSVRFSQNLSTLPVENK